MFSGGLIQPNEYVDEAPTVNTGGGSNTVWGNTFDQVVAPQLEGGETLVPDYWGTGLEVGENSDLIYNNWFATPTTAFMLPMNLYSDYGSVHRHVEHHADRCRAHQHGTGLPDDPAHREHRGRVEAGRQLVVGLRNDLR